MNKIKIKAFAKINLLLDIVAKRTDGYHDLFMVMQSIGVYDTVSVAKNDTGEIKITCNIDNIPLDRKNIAYKAAELFFEKTNIENTGIDIDIVKRIPHSAGLAGGSADGAAVLVALNKLYSAGLSDDELCGIGVKVGADVPFCIKGGTLLAQGVGDVLSKFKPLKKCYIVLAKPEAGVNTAQAYSQFDKVGKTHTPDKIAMINAIQNGEISDVASNMENVFEQFIDVPDKVEIKYIMRESGALGTCMSGSGPTVFAIYDDEEKAKSVLDKLKPYAKDILLTEPVEKGCIIVD